MLIYFLKLCCVPNTVILKTMLATLTLKENNMDLAFGENTWLSFGASFTCVSNWTGSAFPNFVLQVDSFLHYDLLLQLPPLQELFGTLQ